MVIFTAKVSKKKLILAVAAVAALATLLTVLIRSSGRAETPEGVPVTGISSNEDRIAFLRAYGWEVVEEPLTTQQVSLPDTQSELLAQYCRLQEAQGFSLRDYADATITRYVYAVTNYPDAKGDVYATVLQCKKRIVGGDISCRWEGGKMTGFSGCELP